MSTSMVEYYADIVYIEDSMLITIKENLVSELK